MNDVAFFETAGFSMWPFLRPGQRLIIKPCAVSELKTGDMVLYQNDNQLVCHRLIKKEKHAQEYLLYTRGDNSNYRLECIPESRLKGKVIGIAKESRVINLSNMHFVILGYFMAIFAPAVSFLPRTIKSLLKSLKII